MILRIFLGLCSVCLSIVCTNNQSNLSNDGEDFKEFFQKFSTDKAFQLERTTFPFQDCDLGGNCDTIQKSNWTHLPLLYGETRIFTFYDNLERKLKDSNERVFAIEGIENSIANFYYFKRTQGLWYLIKRESSDE